MSRTYGDGYAFVFSVPKLAGRMASTPPLIERENMRFNLPLVVRVARYFRTEAELLWDRRVRFDRIFGSGDTRAVERAPALLQESWDTQVAEAQANRARALAEKALPSPATHAILIQLKAGETADLLYRV